TKEVQTQIDFAGRTIVVIEDEDWQRGALSMFLESLGCQVIAARSATEAVSRVKMEGIFPDIVVSDFRLAERKTGLEAISTIRLAVGQRVPAVLVTGDTDPQRLRQAKRGGYT
ncbi:response regulator, partial [Azospirillum argentinense]